VCVPKPEELSSCAGENAEDRLSIIFLEQKIPALHLALRPINISNKISILWDIRVCESCQAILETGTL
jgi:hypothetical protein